MAGQQTIQRWFDGLNGGKVASDLVESGFTYRGGDREFSLDELQQRVAEYRQTYPELLFTVDFVVEHGDKIGVAWTAVTRSKSTKGVGTATVRNGKVVEFSGVMPNL